MLTNARGDSIDMSKTAKTFGIELTPVETYIENALASTPATT
jgi:hypothetical protein